MRTSLEGFGRVPDIESRDRELNGFLSLFAKLPADAQARVLQDIERLKTEVGNNPEALLAEVKAFAAMYGAVAKGAGEQEKNTQEGLRVRIEEIIAATGALKEKAD